MGEFSTPVNDIIGSKEIGMGYGCSILIKLCWKKFKMCHSQGLSIMIKLEQHQENSYVHMHCRS